ncbi:GntR family transcriptional regulator [Streptomyces justiciae]|uniref:GntR family transcriptional regulator n=1 Tax=Streptomyces justiciae TaxID=2780140 RepID=UPI002117B4E0|nr:GntR family transcriptional regulator [Streptomyces justiciae]MCW8378684.1 GntR family transcriptional regulator [Streptomyces justiciae]
MSDSGLDVESLGESAYRRLRADIISCRLAPGERLTERALAAATGFGVSPIRDALKRLDHEGLVRTLPRKGYQVRPLTIKTVDDLFDFWSVLGPEVARRGVSRASDAQIGYIVGGQEEAVRLMREQGYTPEVSRRMVAIVDEMFTVLAEATGNDYMIGAHARVSGELERVWTLVTDSGLLDVSAMPVPEGERWKSDFLRRDTEGCAELARSFIDQSRRQVLRTLVRWPSVIATEVVTVRGAIAR